MPLSLTTDVRNALKARNIASAWLIELACDEGTLRCWDKAIPINYESENWEPLGSQVKIVGELKTSVNLIAQPLILEFDGAGQLDDTTFVGRLLDRTWWQRSISVRQLLMVPNSNFTTVIGLGFQWFGYMDKIDAPEGDGDKSKVVLSCESGVFRLRGRNMRTYTDRDQREFDANDASFKNVGTKPFQDIPFGDSWANVPGGTVPPRPAYNGFNLGDIIRWEDQYGNN